jgi:hypothetical protein
MVGEAKNKARQVSIEIRATLAPARAGTRLTNTLAPARAGTRLTNIFEPRFVLLCTILQNMKK